MYVLKTAPALEPVSLAQAKKHLRLDSVSFADDISSEQTIAPGDHVIAAAYSLEGDAVDVLGYQALVTLEAGTNGAGGTVDVKLQHSHDNITWVDVTSGAFDQVTTANDNATYEKEYTGGRQYLRAVATVAVDTCDFGVSVLKDITTTQMDAYLTTLITVARKWVEKHLRRSLITQTWELVMDDWPTDPFRLAYGPLQSVTSIVYYDTDDTVATFAATYYYVDTYAGRIGLNYAEVWPTETLRPINGIIIEFVAGYGDAATDVPEPIYQAMLILIAHLYENPELVTMMGGIPKEIPMSAQALLSPYRDLRVF